MLEKVFLDVYTRFKLNFYKNVFSRMREREGSLSATEAFSLEVIYVLDSPTISEFARFIGVSQSGATYKVNSLISKGYLERENSFDDKREYHLKLTEKYFAYNSISDNYISLVMERMRVRFTPEQLETFEYILNVMGDELMEETGLQKKKKTRCNNE